MYPLVLVRTEVHITKWASLRPFLLTAVMLCGCKYADSGQTKEQQPQQETATKLTKLEQVQRFVPIPGEYYSGGLALDTKTGQLCRTWAWVPTVGKKDIALSTPVCKNLYDADQFPKTLTDESPHYPPGSWFAKNESGRLVSSDGAIHSFSTQADAEECKKTCGIK